MTGPSLLATASPDWFALVSHFLSLSLLSVGGAMAMAPEMHRYLVLQQHWLTDAQFTAGVAIAHIAPGPNVLFVALIGWQIGMQAGGAATALLAAVAALASILLPSTVLTCVAAGWIARHRDLWAVRTFRQGMAPLVVGLMLATGWILADAPNTAGAAWPLWLLTAASTFLVLTRRGIPVVGLLAVGALLGSLGAT